MARGKTAPRARDLSEEERDLWAAVTRETKALNPAGGRRTVRDEEEAAAAPPESMTPTPSKPNAAAPRPGAPHPDPQPSGAVPRPGAGTDRRTQVRLRRGQVQIDGRIDLHGMTQAQARARLETFVAAGASDGRRCVLVITGKGSVHADDEPGLMPDRERGVLREQVPRWLALPPLAGHVITWQPAARRHGGDGALYVLLRRRK